MKFSLFQENISVLRRQRSILSMALGVCLISNMVLAFCAFFKTEHWVLVPQFDTAHKSSLTHNSYSDEYLTDWAASVTQDLLTTNPASVDMKMLRFSQVSVRGVTVLQKELQKTMTAIKKDKISTVFYPKEFVISASQHMVTVKGSFYTYFGHDKVPVVVDKIFDLFWQRGPHGVILVKELREKINEI